MEQENNEQTEAVNWGQRLCALAGILLIAIGQYRLRTQVIDETKILPDSSWWFLLGMGILIISLFIRSGQRFQRIASRLNISETGFGVLASLLLCFLTIASYILFHTNGKVAYLSITLLWFATGIAYILAFRNRDHASFDIKKWYADHRTELILVILAVAIGAILRLYRLGDVPRIIDGDEGLIGLFAQSTKDGYLASPFALWENFGASYLQLVNFLFEIMGTSPSALRLLPAISGILAIPAVYLFARQVAGIRVALISAFLLAVAHSHIHFSRIASVGYIHGTWLAPLELYLLLSGLEKRSSWRMAAAGVLLAMHLQVYLTSQIIIGLVLVYMFISYLFLRNWFRPALRQVAVLWGGFTVALLPQLYFILNNSNEFFSRLSADGTFQSGWLTSTMTASGKSAIEILAGRVSHAFLSLIYYPAVDFYGSNAPLLNIFVAILFIMGLSIAIVRTKSPGFLMLNGYFWAGTFAIGVFSIPPSADSYRMLMTLPPVIVMAAMGLDHLMNMMGFSWEKSPGTYIFSATGVMVAMSIIGVWTYYFDFAGNCRYGGGQVGRFASYLGGYAGTVDQNSDIYLLSDSIYFYGTHASTDFLSQHRPIANYPEAMDSYEIKYGETIVASPPRIPELLTWAEAHPGGSLTRLYDCDNLILVAYQIPEKSFGP
jgi:hypothetical protein